MNFYYVNSNNEKIDFTDYPYVFQEGDLLDYSWNYETQENTDINKITSFKKGITQKSIKIAVIPPFDMTKKEREEKIKEYFNHIFEVFEYDIINDSDGKLYTDTGYYLPCRIYESTKSDWNMGLPFMFNDFKVVSANPYWIRKQQRDFTGAESSSVKGLNYPYNYLYNYTPVKRGISYWQTDNFSYSDFELIIYGPCINPRILINNYPYEVFDTLENYEYLIIKSVNEEKSVIKYRNNGTTLNIFDLRGKENSVFNKIPPGRLTFNWRGDFKFTLKLYEKRSEPKW
ncbi:hypothetical protein [Anaerofustis butyriciformans]|uniref:hypothetical protein n=1 Tax=Anaerofustis butyriciformans TaxID=3108533 RepID=UPI002E359EC8|nr:hypothetical protein [Anaerofustis sp. HA2171]